MLLHGAARRVTGDAAAAAAAAAGWTGVRSTPTAGRRSDGEGGRNKKGEHCKSNTLAYITMMNVRMI